MKLQIGQWSARHECCIGCGSVNRPHHGRGLCRTCYNYTRFKPKPHGYIERHPKRWDEAERRRLRKIMEAE